MSDPVFGGSFVFGLIKAFAGLMILGVVMLFALFALDWFLGKLRKHFQVETIPTRELRPEYRNALEGIPNLWCSSCRMSELVCDLHPRVPFEACECGEGVPRACPLCTDYDVTALLEEIAKLRAERTTS